jgi:C1A family cysteine protease
VTGFQDVESGSEDAMKEALSEGPVSVAIEADQGVFQFYKSGVVTSKECGQNLDHGVLAVGYGDYKDEKTGDTIPYWLVKNSWGTVWGQEGYVMISRTVTASGDSECGILSQPSFPKLQKSVESVETPTAVTYI